MLTKQSSNRPCCWCAIAGGSSLLYTVHGGLLTSIITNQFHAAAALFLAAVLGLYVAATFRHRLAVKALTAAQLGTTSAGYAAIFTMPAALCSSLLFNERAWQR
jgi:hypothetical protein